MICHAVDAPAREKDIHNYSHDRDAGVDVDVLPSVAPEPLRPRRSLADLAISLATGRTPSAVNVAGWVLLAAGVIVLLGQLVRPVDPQDEGQLLTYPWLIAHGSMPYRDLWMSYPPGIYLVLAGLLKAGLPGLLVERGLAVIAFLGTILLVNRAMTGTWSRLSWIGVPAAFSLLFTSSDVRAYPWLVALPLFLWGLFLTRRHPYTGAALFFLAGTLRFEFAFAGLLALLVLTAWPSRGLAHGRVAAASIGLAVSFVLFYLAFDLMTSGAAFKDIFLDQILPVEAARRLPLWPPQFGPLGVPIALVMLAAPCALVVAGLIRRGPFTVATNLAVLSLLPHFFQRADASHLFSTSAVIIPWALICLVDPEWLERSSEQRPAGCSRRKQGVALGLAAIGLLVAAWGSLIVAGYGVYLSPLSPLASQHMAYFSALRVSTGSNTIIAWTPSEARDDRRVIAYLRVHARSSDSVFIEPLSLASTYTMTDLYYALGLRPATRYLEMQGGIETQTSVQREITRELDACRWIVVLRGGHWYWGPTNRASVRQHTLYETYIAQHYRAAYATPTYLILKRSTASIGREG